MFAEAFPRNFTGDRIKNRKPRCEYSSASQLTWMPYSCTKCVFWYSGKIISCPFSPFSPSFPSSFPSCVPSFPASLAFLAPSSPTGDSVLPWTQAPNLVRNQVAHMLKCFCIQDSMVQVTRMQEPQELSRWCLVQTKQAEPDSLRQVQVVVVRVRVHPAESSQRARKLVQRGKWGGGECQKCLRVASRCSRLALISI